MIDAYEYYPFGGITRGISHNTGTDEKFTGKELDNDNDENLYYFGARYYDGALGRWNSVDPMASKYPGWSPYNYCLNNPNNVIDPDGTSAWEKIKNLITQGEWRDDTIKENFEQKDWENATPQLAKEAGIDIKKVNVKYDPNNPNPQFSTSSDGETMTVTTTKNGFEQLGESNIENNRSSMRHEGEHVEEGAEVIQKAASGEYPEIRIEVELRAIKAQKSDKSWSKTTATYKQKIETYKQHFLRMKKIGENLK